ncbi:polysaccharide lyase family 7 protein [Mariniflexile sp. AS56]|uniref:polysaccharide lyase family 7 protein n=1 Tax=Mariniflexile sp. AS56 TaxID=3063957 RepID=UPI0026ECDA03|nr:polysaccharide lyase family 7 protein [Mariniflexile sp. AS56]MDO7171270.1 polysaccharide lyase family 7 protein [Mariniflexile sp. AS56]
MKKAIALFFVLSVLPLIYACSTSDAEEEKEIINEEIVEEPNEPPAEDPKFIWKNWYLSVPINRGDGNATSIYYQAIESNTLTAAQSEYFKNNTDGSYTMFTKFTGFTTSGESALNGGKYCRTELREFWKGNQTTSDNWSMSTGTHIMETTLKVDFVEGNGRTIVAQIHGIETTGSVGAPATVKIRWNSGEIQLDYYTKPNNGDPWTSAYDNKTNVGKVDNELFTFKIKIENGKFYYALVCEAKGINTDYTFVYDYVANNYAHNNYFKTGNYYGWNADYEKRAQVTLHAVKTQHF